MISGNFWKISSLIVASLLLCSLTPQEQATLKHARQELRSGAAQYKQAQTKIAAADARAAASEKYALDTYNNALKVQADIDAAHKREQALVAEVNDLRGLRDRVYAHWGLGAFAVGFGILTKHLLILGLVVAILIGVLYGLSFVFPLAGIALKVAFNGIRIAFSAVAGIFKRKPPTS